MEGILNRYLKGKTLQQNGIQILFISIPVICLKPDCESEKIDLTMCMRIVDNIILIVDLDHFFISVSD